MSVTATETPVRQTTIGALPFYYGWVMVAVGALAMLATMPGRTHGLGLISERLLGDTRLELDRVRFGDINLIATLLGAAFCLPCGWLIDRFGLRFVLTGVVLALSAVVLTMSLLTGHTAFFVAILLTRGFGQGALSVLSITLVGKWFRRRQSVAMGVYSLLVAVGFSGAFLAAKPYRDADWRMVWSGIGFFLLFGMAPIAWVLVRNSPEACGIPADGDDHDGPDSKPVERAFSLGGAVRTPAFWMFGLSTSFYGMIAAGVSLFNESLLAERGFDKNVYYELSAFTPLVGLASNLAAGWIARHWSIGRLTAAAMLVLAGSLFWFPHVTSYQQAVGYAVGMAAAGGIVTVVFFMVWGQLYGRAHLGKIQGMAQMLTVIASALGPSLFARCHAWTSSYSQLFFIMAGVAALFGVAAWCTPLPRPTLNLESASRY